MPNKVLLSLLFSSLLSSVSYAAICGRSDDRELSTDAKVARLSRDGRNNGCTVTMVSNKCGITSGSCVKSSADFAEFNPPLSVGGVAMPARAEDQYRVDLSFYEFDATVKIGENWGVIKFDKNSLTGLYPGQAQGFYKMISKKLDKNAPIRVVSYGGDNRSETNTFAQQTSKGPATKPGIFLLPTIIEFAADTGWASSGSPIISEETNELAGITTHEGCDTTGSNAGTYLYNNKKVQNALAACLKE